MDQKKPKGLSDEELIKKYGDVKNPEFNEMLKKTKTDVKHHTTSTSPTPLKGVIKTK